ncbi:MAG: 1-acyl-sn-glycerol-3-phosphate acyltransferase, partial [Bacteroidota bacterium]
MTSPMNPRSGTEHPPILSRYLLPALRLALTTGAYWYAAPVLLGAAAGRLDGILPPCRVPAAVRLGGLVLALAGGYLFLRAWLTLATMGKEWPRSRPVLLVVDHIYAFARHPLYLGYAAAFLGWSIWRSSPGLCLVSMALGLTLAGYARFVEEPMLLARFGSRFADYRRRVPFFTPRWRALREGALELNLFLLFTLLVFRWLFRFLWRVEVEGQEHVPERGGFLLVANHVNLADPFLIGLFLTRRVHFMASDELFRRPLFRLLFGKFWPAFPKRRWGRDIGALRHAERLLARGEAVGIFPEGARNWDGGPVSVGDEVYRFIHHCRAPVLAATIRGGHESLPRWASWPSFTRVAIRFFPPLAPEDASSYAELRRRIEPR